MPFRSTGYSPRKLDDNLEGSTAAIKYLDYLPSQLRSNDVLCHGQRLQVDATVGCYTQKRFDIDTSKLGTPGYKVFSISECQMDEVHQVQFLEKAFDWPCSHVDVYIVTKKSAVGIGYYFQRLEDALCSVEVGLHESNFGGETEAAEVGEEVAAPRI